MLGKDLRFTDLINREDWQSIQDSLSEVLEITLRTFSADGNLLTETSRANHLLREILPKAYKQSELCGKCLLFSKVAELKHLKKETNVKCPFDLDAFIVPIRAMGEKTIAYVVLGPTILKHRKNIFEHTGEAEEYGIKLEELSDVLIEVNVFSYNKIKAVIKLVEDVFSRIAQTEHHKKRLGEIKPEVVELDPLFSRYYEEKILNSLLNSCTLALNVDSGSVMTVDKDTKMLYIKAATRLNEDIVNNTNMRVGEGIAGHAAATAESIMLPQDKDKRGLSGRMKRNHIKSSIIVPFNKGNTDEVYGVLSLNMVRKDTKFSKEDIALVKELVNMVSIALTSLRQTSPPDMDFAPNPPVN